MILHEAYFNACLNQVQKNKLFIFTRSLLISVQLTFFPWNMIFGRMVDHKILVALNRPQGININTKHSQTATRFTGVYLQTKHVVFIALVFMFKRKFKYAGVKENHSSWSKIVFKTAQFIKWHNKFETTENIFKNNILAIIFSIVVH